METYAMHGKHLANDQIDFKSGLHKSQKMFVLAVNLLKIKCNAQYWKAFCPLHKEKD